MSSNQKAIRDHYCGNSAKEDSRLRKSRANELEAHCTKLLLAPYITSEMDVVEFGCGLLRGALGRQMQELSGD